MSYEYLYDSKTSFVYKIVNDYNHVYAMLSRISIEPPHPVFYTCIMCIAGDNFWLCEALDEALEHEYVGRDDNLNALDRLP